MPFERVGKIRAGSNPELVTMAVNVNIKSRNLIVHIGEAVAERAGFKMGERAECLWGYGEDTGVLMLAKPDEDGGVLWKDNLPRLTHTTTRVPEWVLAFRMTEAEVLSNEGGELVLKLPPEDEIIKRAPLAASEIKRGKKDKITVHPPAEEQPQHPAEQPGDFARETRRSRFQSGGKPRR